MPLFRCSKNVECAEGYQDFQVEATDEKAAQKLFEKGEGLLVHTEVEVTDLSEYDISTIYEHEDDNE